MAGSTPARGAGEQRFDGPHVAFYLGGVLTIAALTWLMGSGWDQYGAGVGFLLAVVYAAVFVLLARALLARGWAVPGGLMATVVVALTPLIVFSFEQATGLWPDRDYGEYGDFFEWISSSWFAMEVITIVAGIVALWLVRFPFIVAPIAFSAWFASMDLAEVLFSAGASDRERAGVSIAVGVALIAIGWLLDLRRARGYGFWCHLFGLLCMGGAVGYLTAEQGREMVWALTGLLSVLAIVTAVLLQRRTYAVFGGMGLFAWTCHLAFEVFESSLLFPLALAAVGVGIVLFGIAFARHRDDWHAVLIESLPASVLRAVPPADP